MAPSTFMPKFAISVSVPTIEQELLVVFARYRKACVELRQMESRISELEEERRELIDKYKIAHEELHTIIKNATVGD